MKTLDQISLTANQYKALAELKKQVVQSFNVCEIVIFGSVVRGNADDESDLDVLLVTKTPLDRIVRHKITDIVCEINLKHDTNISTTVVDKDAWQTGLYSILPIHREILSEGVPL